MPCPRPSDYLMEERERSALLPRYPILYNLYNATTSALIHGIQRDLMVLPTNPCSQQVHVRSGQTWLCLAEPGKTPRTESDKHKYREPRQQKLSVPPCPSHQALQLCRQSGRSSCKHSCYHIIGNPMKQEK